MQPFWAPAWLATALCVIVVAVRLTGSWESAFPAFFCFLPIVFLQLARAAQDLANRVAELEAKLAEVRSGSE